MPLLQSIHDNLKHFDNNGSFYLFISRHELVEDRPRSLPNASPPEMNYVLKIESTG